MPERPCRMAPFAASLLTIVFVVCDGAYGQSIPDQFLELAETSCFHCHDANTDTGLNFESIELELSDPDVFREWVAIFDRVSAGEMPPNSEPAPDTELLQVALESLRSRLHEVSSRQQQEHGRVSARRLTKKEYGYTIQDLFDIQADVTLAIPDEIESGTFDTVGETQRISAVHMEGYMQAANDAYEAAIRLGRNPFHRRDFDFHASAFLNDFHDKEISLGGNVSQRLDEGVVVFHDVDYLLRSDIHGYSIRHPGHYRIRLRVEAYQATEPLTFKLIVRDPSSKASLIDIRDLTPGESTDIEINTYLSEGDTFYPTFESDLSVYARIQAVGGAKNYRGRGLAVRSMSIEGPINDSWPPTSTELMLPGIEFESQFANSPQRVALSGTSREGVETVVRGLVARTFRRLVSDEEIESFVELADPAIEADREFLEAVSIPVTAMLASPQFLMFDEKVGRLDQFAVANRLSYFLWKSMPDDELFALALDAKLTDADVLIEQVDRMLADEKANRFVEDFLGQWLLLDKLNVTTPDDGLYPEYDELLNNAIPHEPRLFFRELIDENMSASNLINSDFTFLNRRLAEHYGISDVVGQEFRRVDLDPDSVRGGFLTQAAVLKTTANGTVTSPVTRGNFILTNILGTPPSPPPSSVGSIEPDTRGQQTIREILSAHRRDESCNQCHRSIDPPGFALESFDPIGGYRTSYRATTSVSAEAAQFSGAQSYRRGPEVDSSGTTQDGESFDGITEFKEILLRSEEQIAKHFLTRLIVYSTGAEVQFADRQEIDQILERLKQDQYPIKDFIYEVVQSEIFLHK